MSESPVKFVNMQAMAVFLTLQVFNGDTGSYTFKAPRANL